MPSSTRGVVRLVGLRDSEGAKRLPCWRVREDALLAFDRRLCCDAWLRRAVFVASEVALEVVRRKGASVNGS